MSNESAPELPPPDEEHEIASPELQQVKPLTFVYFPAEQKTLLLRQEGQNLLPPYAKTETDLSTGLTPSNN